MFNVGTELTRKWNSQQYQKVLFLQIYKVHPSKISKLWVGEAPKQFDLSMFRNTLLNVKTSFNGFFVAECLFLRPKASGCVHVAWSGHIRSWQEQGNQK